MTWEDILKTKTEKPTKVMDSPSPEYYDRDAESYGSSPHVYGLHFNTCDVFKGGSCNCYGIAKDWVNESEFAKDVLMDTGVGGLNSRGESSVTMKVLEDMERKKKRRLERKEKRRLERGG